MIDSPKYPRASTFKLLSNSEWEKYKKIVDDAKKSEPKPSGGLDRVIIWVKTKLCGEPK
jgi:hypothetical protein